MKPIKYLACFVIMFFTTLIVIGNDIIGDKVIEKAFKFMACFWMLSPAIFIFMRWFGIFDYKYDWGIGAGLALISFLTMFLTYKRW